MYRTPYFCRILVKLEILRQIFSKYRNIKFYENSSSGSQVVPWGRTDRRTVTTKLFTNLLSGILQTRLKRFLFPQKLRLGSAKFRPLFTHLHKQTQNPITPPLRRAPDSTMLPTKRVIYMARACLWSLITSRRLCPSFHHCPRKYFSIAGKGIGSRELCCHQAWRKWRHLPQHSVLRGSAVRRPNLDARTLQQPAATYQSERLLISIEYFLLSWILKDALSAVGFIYYYYYHHHHHHHHYSLQLSFHSVAVVFTLVQTKQIIYINETIPKHSTNNTKHSKYKYTYYQNTHT